MPATPDASADSYQATTRPRPARLSHREHPSGLRSPVANKTAPLPTAAVMSPLRVATANRQTLQSRPTDDTVSGRPTTAQHGAFCHVDGGNAASIAAQNI